MNEISSRVVFFLYVDHRYKNTLDETLRFGTWTYEEDRLLWQYIQEHGEGMY